MTVPVSPSGVLMMSFARNPNGEQCSSVTKYTGPLAFLPPFFLPIRTAPTAVYLRPRAPGKPAGEGRVRVARIPEGRVSLRSRFVKSAVTALRNLSQGRSLTRGGSECAQHGRRCCTPCRRWLSEALF
eukprot:CAMPEP_0181361350 /NCGR_PEP_ID=MMETSP1106-20121128/7231_1 /TAXON_ID=81844 /ORGANISM="Mantoniella antarctica, Strain SL-175" /LENGTH=127 /DNA_ID=CAMNT_0023474841 /DNA_START=586 /DNA_END=969 /DNA_ORIENTATION=-